MDPEGENGTRGQRRSRTRETRGNGPPTGNSVIVPSRPWTKRNRRLLFFPFDLETNVLGSRRDYLKTSTDSLGRIKSLHIVRFAQGSRNSVSGHGRKGREWIVNRRNTKIFLLTHYGLLHFLKMDYWLPKVYCTSHFDLPLSRRNILL